MQREEILAAAAQIFRDKGYHATSMQDIAEAVHLQKGSLYHHIRSKEEILASLLDRALDLLILSMQEVMASPLSVEQKLRSAMRMYADNIAVHSDLAAVLLLEYRNLSPRLRARHMGRRDRFEALWRELLRQGMQQGVFRTSDEKLVALAILGVQNWMLTWYRPEGPLSAAELSNRFADLFLNGLLTHGASD
ncbi:MAG TPA: TetR/AcrR family transcriptional regulator [Anaerolineales bacterium]|nr:TetR/AcrR family transcriptional regulator [Anaerolineales bacterium]